MKQLRSCREKAAFMRRSILCAWDTNFESLTVNFCVVATSFLAFYPQKKAFLPRARGAQGVWLNCNCAIAQLNLNVLAQTAVSWGQGLGTRLTAGRY